MWTPYSLVRVALVFTAGIVLGLYFPDVLPISYANFIFASLSSTFIVIAWLKWRGFLKYVNAGFIGIFALFAAGYIHVHYSTDYHDPYHFVHDTRLITFYQARITSQSQLKEKSWKAEAEVVAVKNDSGTWSMRSGKVLLYFSREDYQTAFAYGDVLLIRGHPDSLKGPSNPGEFDYKQFLSYRKTYHQDFLREGDAIKTGHNASSTIFYYSIRAREWAEGVICANVKGKQEQATASALVLGITAGLDSDLIGAYAATGSLHVLSVSGLHVGIIYWLILLMLRPLNRTTNGKWVLAVFSIVVLWVYAFITGVSPSVLRAVTMFSFVALARPWGQMTNIYNTLAASAFCLLLYEPYLVMSVGFQLSYLAVVGIVYLQPKLVSLWQPASWLWEQVWQMTCVSVAAQAATVAVGLLYFHQFPVYFLFSNLFVIPVSFVVLVLGIVVVAVGFIAPVAAALGFLLQWSIWFLNYGVVKMESLPGALLDNVNITPFQCWVLMGTLLCIVLLFELRNVRYLVLASGLILTFSVVDWFHFLGQVRQKNFIVYNISGHSAWDVMEDGRVYFFTDSLLQADHGKVQFHMRPNRLQHGVQHTVDGSKQPFCNSLQGCRLVVWHGMKILQLQRGDFRVPQRLEIDYIVAGSNVMRSVDAVKGLKFKKLILDSSNSFYFAERLLKDALAEGIPIHSVQHHGAFIAKT